MDISGPYLISTKSLPSDFPPVRTFSTAFMETPAGCLSAPLQRAGLLCRAAFRRQNRRKFGISDPSQYGYGYIHLYIHTHHGGIVWYMYRMYIYIYMSMYTLPWCSHNISIFLVIVDGLWWHILIIYTVYIYIYTYIHAYIHTCIHTYIYAFINISKLCNSEHPMINVYCWILFLSLSLSLSVYIYIYG